ncbi:MAG: hypothetical protein AAGC93_20985 [Cyanobacteria bacterium P01_F01_bin.53]
MGPAQILEWPHPEIDEDWDNGQFRWREITPLAYRELKQATPLRDEAPDAFMQSEPVDILANGDGLYVCCKKARGFYFARLLAGEDWWKRDYLPLPELTGLP